MMKNADFDLVVIGGGPAIFTTEHTENWLQVPKMPKVY